jgi:protein gp37
LGDRTSIEWTDATWNPVTGCTKVSSGCDHCYAASLAERRLREVYLRRAPVADTPENRADPFAVRLWPERLEQPTKWREPRMVFVNSMSDLFHVDVPDSYVRDVFRVMLSVDRHIYQVLTKRPARALRFWRKHSELFGGENIPEHIWIGTSIESQDVVFRANHLRQVPATMRFLSCEPMLGPLTLNLASIHWVIAGGESGAGYRPLDLAWVRGIRDQCRAQNVAFFFKQVGGRTPKAGGRSLDDRTWDEWPVMRRGGRSAVAGANA